MVGEGCSCRCWRGYGVPARLEGGNVAMFPHVQLLEPWAASGTWNRPAGEEARMAHIKNSPLLGPDRRIFWAEVALFYQRDRSS